MEINLNVSTVEANHDLEEEVTITGVALEPESTPMENDKILNAKWGSMKGLEIRSVLMKTYKVVAGWKRNLYQLGKQEKVSLRS